MRARSRPDNKAVRSLTPRTSAAFTPGDAVGGDVPVVDDFADRGEDRPRIEGDAGRAAVRSLRARDPA